MMNKTKRNSGFSIMETVIALAVIVIVTAAALTVTMAAINARVKVENYSEAQDFAQNVLECFKAADKQGEFESNLAFAGYDGWSKENVDYEYAAGNKYSAEIKADVNSGEFEITVYDNKDEEIISLQYQKKGAES